MLEGTRSRWVLLGGWLVAVASACWLPSAALSQGEIRRLDLRGLQGMTFADIVAGLPSSVSRDDPDQRGEFLVRGANDAEVVLSFTLPADLVGPGGASLPIRFGVDDAGYHPLPQGRVRGFDPASPLVALLGTNGHSRVYLGATVWPAISQRAGLYRATVTLTAAYTGN